MSDNNDFSPIVEEGELDPAVGLLSRLRRRRDLPPVGAGFERILLDEQGSPLLNGDQLTAGQKYWSRVRSWVKVDVRQQNLKSELKFSDPTGKAGFVATVIVATKVEDSAAAVKSGAISVKAFLNPAIQQAIGYVDLDTSPADDSDPAGALSSMCAKANASLGKALVGEVPDLPEWLSAKFKSVTVRLDAATAEHHEELLKRSRGGQLLEADGANKRIETTQEMDLRDLVRERLAPHFSDPVARAFEMVASDPSTGNIEKVVAAVNNTELEHRAVILSILEDAIDKDFLDKEDPMYQAMVEMVVKALKGAPVTGNAGALGGGQAGLAPAAGVVEGETIDGDHETEEVEGAVEGASDGEDEPGENQVGDRTWNDS